MDKPVNITPAELASLMKRFSNFFIDRMLLCGFITVGLSYLGAYLKKAYGFEGLDIGAPAIDNIKFSLANTAVCIAYYGLFETILGQTPGKFVTNTRVIMRDGSKPGNTPILVRTLCREIPFEPLSFLFMPRMGLHDFFSKTLVVDNYAYERARRNENRANNTEDYTDEI